MPNLGPDPRSSGMAELLLCLGVSWQICYFYYLYINFCICEPHLVIAFGLAFASENFDSKNEVYYFFPICSFDLFTLCNDRAILYVK